jgi:hypothetical protein
MKEMTAHFVPVDLGIVNNERAQILTPPLTGQVVTLGHHLLEEGSSVILPGRGDARKKPEEESRDGRVKQ